MSATSHGLITPRDIARILFRQWRKLALLFFGVLVLTLLIISGYPRWFASEAKLLIRVGRETVGLDPSATTGQTLTLHKTQDDELNSAINILESREVLQRVVERVGATRILNPTSDGSTSDGKPGAVANLRARVQGWLEAVRLTDPGMEEDQAVRRLADQMAVSAPKGSMVITLSYTARSPELARDVVKAFTEVFLDEHARLSRTEGSLEFFANQVDRLHKDLLAAQAELRDRKNSYRLTTAANRRSILESAKDAMRQKIYDLEVQESELRSRYTDAYPPLREIQRQREQAERLLTELPGEAPMLHDNVNGSTATAQQMAAAEESKLFTELRLLNDQEFELAQLEREVKLLEGKYAMHVEKLEQARLNDALGRERITNVKVAQAATLVRKPVAPKKAVIAGLGLVVAVFGGIGLAFLAEGFDQTLRTSDQVEAELGLPVLASLPYRKPRGKRRARSIDAPAGVHSNGNGPLPIGHGQHGSYSGLVTAVQATGENGHERAKTVGIVGCDPSKVHSRVAGDFAIEAATSGAEPVLLIDADARGRRISKRFRLNGAPGWRDVAAGSAAAESCVQWLQPGSLAIIGPGESNGQAQRRTATTAGLEKLGEIKSRYGLVVVDLPPMCELGSSPPIVNLVDETVLVVEAERTRIRAAQRARDILDRTGVHITGVVLTNRRDHIPGWLYRRL